MNYVFELIYQQLFFCVCNLCDKEFEDRWQILRAQFQTFRQSRRRVMEDNRFHIFFDDDNQMIVCLLLQSGKDKRIFVWFFVVVLRLFRFRFDISSSNICSIVFKSLLTNKCLGIFHQIDHSSIMLALL